MADSQKNILIIGAGIMGLSAAYALKQAHKVTLAEQVFPPKKASVMAGGMLSPYSEIEHMPGRFIDAGLAGIDFWEDFSKHHDIGFQRQGSLLIAHEEDRYILERFRSHLPQTLSEEEETGDYEPILAKRFPKALHLEQEAHLDPQKTLKTLADCVQISEINLNPDDPLHLKHYDYVIDCRGYDAARDDKDLRGVKGEIITVENREFQLSRPVRLMHPRYSLYIVPRGNHIFTIGATQIESAEDESISLRSAMELMSALYSLNPSFGEARILDMKAGIRPAYPDNLPRITIDAKLIRCNGLFRHGYLLAPVMAACVADHIAGRTHEFMDLFTGGNDDYHRQRTEEGIQKRA